MLLNRFFKGTIVDILEPKTTGGQICRWNTKALLSDTVVIIVADKKNTKLNIELRNQLFKEYCGIYTGVVILKDTDIKLGDELRILKGIGINSLILRCFLTTPIYEHLRGVLGTKMLNNRDAYFKETPKPVKKIKIRKDKMIIKVYGEMHFFIEEVDEIRGKIVDDEPTIILLENMEDSEYYKKNTKAKVYRLEPEYKDKGESLVKQFLTRERAMIATIKAVIKESDDNNIICIQVGDTHLRTIYTKELGLATLNQYLVTIDDIEIIRSKHGEIK